MQSRARLYAHLLRSVASSLVIVMTLSTLSGCRTAAIVQPPRETRFKTLDGATLFVRETGPVTGPITFYLHGGPGGQITDGGYEMEAFLPERRLVMYDQRGGGRSDRADAVTLTPARHVEDLEELRRHYGQDRVSLIGLSWGSALAAMYAAKYPEHVERIVFLSAMPVAKVPFDAERWKSVGSLPPEQVERRKELRKAMDAASGEELVRLCNENFRIGLYSRYVYDPRSLSRARRCIDDEQIHASGIAPNNTIAMLGDWDFRPMLRTLTMPALVIEGAQTITTLSSPREWAAALPNGRLLLIESAGHANWLDQPEVFRRAVSRFLAGTFPPEAQRVEPES